MGHTPLGTLIERPDYRFSDDFQELLPLRLRPEGFYY
jgi:hypothetical protein